MVVRPFQISDIAGVNALHADIGWSAPSAEQWGWLEQNPAQGQAPIGWVIETDGRIDGFLGYSQFRYHRATMRYTAGTAHSVIVSPRAKGAIRELIQLFLSQSEPFAISIMNANAIGSPIYRHLGLKPLPSPLYDVKLSWVIGPTLALVSKTLRHLAERFPALYSVLGERFTPRASALFDPRRVRWPKGVYVLEDLSDNSSLATFWNALKSEGHIVADRSPATLRWRLSMPDLSVKPLLLGYHDEQGLCAYALAQISKTGPLDLATLEIIDLVALERAPARAIPSLHRALVTATLKMGVMKLRLPLVSPKLYAALGKRVRSARNEGHWGHAFAQFNLPEAEFSDWHPTPYEGCYGFTLRQLRLDRVKRRQRKNLQVLVASEG